MQTIRVIVERDMKVPFVLFVLIVGLGRVSICVDLVLRNNG